MNVEGSGGIESWDMSVSKSGLRIQPKLNTWHLVSKTFSFSSFLSLLIIRIMHICNGNFGKYKLV